MTNDDMNTQEDIEDVLKQENDKEYFESYNNISVHELMLKDKPRTLAYMHAIKNNSHLFRDKIVMDVGAGTGILSMFAAKLGGARHVYAIEASGTAHIAASVIQENGLSDVITVVQQTVESIKELPHKVDVIISEWMGFYLVHESMLDSVLVARDRFLATDGVMFPSKANIYAAAADMSDVFMEKLGFWEDVYGVQQLAHQELVSKPYVGCLTEKNLISDRELIYSFDCKTVQASELHEILKMNYYRVNRTGILHGFVLWFDVVFEGKNNVVLATGPADEPTHWKQTTILLPQAFEVEPGTAIPVSISITADDEVNHRHYTLSLEFADDDE